MDTVTDIFFCTSCKKDTLHTIGEDIKCQVCLDKPRRRAKKEPCPYCSSGNCGLTLSSFLTINKSK